MSSPRSQLLMAGAPRTGKTSFLALLWLAIVEGRTSSIELAHFQHDREYLNLIAGRLQRCEDATHTESNEDRDLTVALLLGPEKRQITLTIPDLSGETWLEATIQRRWPTRLESMVEESQGLILFIHANRIDIGPSKGVVNELALALVDEESSAEETSIAPNGDGIPTDSLVGEVGVKDETEGHKPPTQVAVVDYLQLVCEQRGPRPARVSLVISAWDLAGGGLTPGEFVARNLPLVDQYVDTNQHWLESEFFGLSAQGGDFGDVNARKGLALGDPVERAEVLGADGSDRSVEDIVLWALGHG